MKVISISSELETQAPTSLALKKHKQIRACSLPYIPPGLYLSLSHTHMPIYSNYYIINIPNSKALKTMLFSYQYESSNSGIRKFITFHAT